MKLSLDKKLSPRTAGALIALALAASVVASRESSEPEVVAPVRAEAPRPPSSERTTTAGLDLDLDKLRRHAHEGGVTELFGARAQPAVAGAPNGGNGGNGQPAVPPGPPALPFQYLGKLIESGKQPRIFLGKDTQLYTVTAGQTVENLYKVDRVTEEAVTFTYLPMGASQTLTIPARS